MVVDEGTKEKLVTIGSKDVNLEAYTILNENRDRVPVNTENITDLSSIQELECSSSFYDNPSPNISCPSDRTYHVIEGCSEKYCSLPSDVSQPMGYRQDRRFELMKLQTLQDGFITERQFNNMYAQFGGEFKCAPYLTGEPSITCPADRAEFEYTGCVERVVPEGTPSQSNGLSGYEYYPDPCDGAMENAFRFISGTDPRLQNDERYGKSVAWNLRTTLSNEGEGDIYYHNEGTNQAQWKRPVPEPADLPDGWIQKETRLVFTPKSKEIVFKNSGFQHFIKANFTNINLKNKKVFGEKEDFDSQNYATIALDTKYPLINYKNENSYSKLTPRIFTKYTAGKTKNNFSTETYFNVNDLYSINRLNDQENFDKDFSVGYGISWDKYNFISSSRSINQNFEIGQVIRERENQLLPSSSSLNNKSSDFVGSYSFTFNGKKNKNINKDLNVLSLFDRNFFSLTYDFAIDNNASELNKNSLELAFGNRFINVSNAYYELRNHIGNTRFNETSTNILLSNNYYISSNYRKNLDTDKSESASFSINYENDCIRYSLSTDKTFYLDKDLKPDRTITFNIIIKPYGEGFAPDLSKFID